MKISRPDKFPLTVIVKPTKRCNLSCKYCYEDTSRDNKSMDNSTLEKVIFEVLAYNDQAFGNGKFVQETEFIWHGGEPLLMGKDFFQKIKSLQQEYLSGRTDHKVKNGVQSNLTLLTPELWTFLRDEDFVVGSSLDGSKEIHDRCRVYQNGEGSYKAVIEAIDYTRPTSRSFSPIGVLVVLTKDKLDQISELYHFFKQQRINFDFGQLSVAGKAEENRSSLEVSAEEWGKAIIELFDLWFYDTTEPSLYISELVKSAAGVLSGSISSCMFSGNCRQSYISINPNGEVYPCGRFGAEETFKLGNINAQSLAEIMQSPTQNYLLSRDIRTIEDCNGCEYKSLCNGGCFYNAYLATGDIFQKDPLCEGYKMVYKHISKRLQEQLTQLLI
ncbi:MAG TPA: radical SAM protein [Candidatus Nanoarchaeia archaeon]|nr:radical SAM protein [Candidatus Nanoarchaeia archaeon]